MVIDYVFLHTELKNLKKNVWSQKREEYQELNAVNLWLDAVQYVLTWKASYLANTSHTWKLTKSCHISLLNLSYMESIYVFWRKHLRFNMGNTHGNKEQM